VITILVQLVVVLLIVGLLLWAIQQFLPIPAPIKNIIYVVIVVILALYLLRVFGIVHI
jgi:hypothetical protein